MWFEHFSLTLESRFEQSSLSARIIRGRDARIFEHQIRTFFPQLEYSSNDSIQKEAFLPYVFSLDFSKWRHVMCKLALAFGVWVHDATWLCCKHRTDTFRLCHERNNGFGWQQPINSNLFVFYFCWLFWVWPPVTRYLGMLASRSFVMLNWTFVTPWQTALYRGKFSRL